MHTAGCLLLLETAGTFKLNVSHTVTPDVVCSHALGLLLGTEAPVMTPNSVDFSLLSFSFSCQLGTNFAGAEMLDVMRNH